MLSALRRVPFGAQILLSLVLGVVLGLVALQMGEVGTADGPAPNWLTSTLGTIGSSFVALLRTIFMFNNFEIIFLLTGGGPLQATMTLPIMVYEQAFGVYELGRGSTIAVVMFLILIAVMSIYFAFLRKEDQ